MINHVECYSGYEYAERPSALHWQGQRLAILEILARWRTPTGLLFRVRTQDEHVFELRYDESTGEWQVVSA